MNRNVREWINDREKAATPRLESIGRAVLTPERATFLESVRELFRPNFSLWAALALTWVTIAAVNGTLVTPPSATTRQASLANLTLTHDEALSLLGTHS